MAVVPVKWSGPASPGPVRANSLACAEGNESPKQKSVHQALRVRSNEVGSVVFFGTGSFFIPQELQRKKA